MKDEHNLAKMLETIRKILSYVQDANYEGFCGNDMLAEACVFNLTQLGEIAHKMSDEFVELHHDLPWNEMYGLRNRLVHDYQGVNLKLVWEIIEEDLPRLEKELESI